MFLSTFLMDPSLTDGGLCQTGKRACTPSSHRHLHLSFYLLSRRTSKASILLCCLTPSPGSHDPSFCVLGPRFSILSRYIPRNLGPTLCIIAGMQNWHRCWHAAIRRIHTFLRNVFSVCGKPDYRPKRTGHHQRLWVCNKPASLCQ